MILFPFGILATIATIIFVLYSGTRSTKAGYIYYSTKERHKNKITTKLNSSNNNGDSNE